MTQENIPHMRRCLRPPPKSEEDFEKIICSTWGHICSRDAHSIFRDDSVTQNSSECQIGSRGFYFSVDVTNGGGDELAGRISRYFLDGGLMVHYHSFMRSLIFNVISTSGSG